MPKKKERSGEEYYRGKLRELSKENQQLKKRIRSLEKTEHMYEEVILGDKDAAYEEVVREETCSQCGKGKLKTFSILDKYTFVECSVCDYRRKLPG